MDGTTLTNVHRRTVDDPAAAGELLQRVHEPESGVWPADAWPPLRLDRGLEPGSSGGHGPIRYAVDERTPTRVRFAFAPDSGLVGWHEFRIEEDVLVHELHLDHPSRSLRLLILPLHDALIEDLFDNMVALGREESPPPRRWSPRVRLLRRLA